MNRWTDIKQTGRQQRVKEYVDSGETVVQNVSSWSPPKIFEASVTRSQLSTGGVCF